jgi:hypothetical protein
MADELNSLKPQLEEKSRYSTATAANKPNSKLLWMNLQVVADLESSVSKQRD